MVEVASARPLQIAATSWLRPAPPAARLIFCGDEAAEHALVAALGLPGLAPACRAVAGAACAALWLGPDERLLIIAADQRLAAIETISSALANHPHSLVDVSHRQIAFEVCGPHAVRLLNSQCPLDLAPAAFPIGMCTRTIYSKSEIVLWRTAGDVFHVEVWRSFAPYMIALLQGVAREYAL
jgi:sarcosine oxidase, subunit gamma